MRPSSRFLLRGIMNGTPVYINGDGEQTRDFTYVENAVQINVKGMLNENQEAFGKVYNVAVGEYYSVNYLYKDCADYLESDWKPTHREPRAGISEIRWPIYPWRLIYLDINRLSDLKRD